MWKDIKYFLTWKWEHHFKLIWLLFRIQGGYTAYKLIEVVLMPKRHCFVFRIVLMGVGVQISFYKTEPFKKVIIKKK